MSGTATVPARGGAATRVSSRQLRQADDTVGGWLLGLIDGKGNSPSQIIVTAVLGCVPVVGQLFDLRDLIRCIIALAAPGAGAAAWVELVITLIGCNPGFGDAFKAGVKLARSGAKADRVFDAMRQYARMDPQKALRQMDWGRVQREAVQLLNRMLDSFIDALDGWLVQLVAGRRQANELIQALRRVKRDAPGLIGQAIGELRRAVDGVLAQPRVRSTAQVSPVHSRPAAPAAGRANTGAPRRDQTGSTPAQRGMPNTAQVRQSKRNRWNTGVPAQHIVDYHVRQTRRPLRKINDHGRLVEEFDRHKKIEDVVVRESVINSAGLDHLWFGPHRGRRYTVGETKGSVWAQFSFLAGMGQQDSAAVASTRTDTAQVLGDKGDANAALGGGAGANATATISSEAALSDPNRQSGTLKHTKTKGRQMSHKWVRMSVETDTTILAPHKRALMRAITHALDDLSIPSIYNREVFMVTGNQYEQHDRSKGAAHHIQPPVIHIPDAILVE